MRTNILCLLLILLATACTNGADKQPAADEPVQEDSDTLGDTLAIEANPPKAADGLFDDFIYSFMKNKRFQKERIRFPLRNVSDGLDKPIDREEWKYDPLYSNQEVYTTIFDSEKSVRAVKDTALHRVKVEWVYLKKKRVKQYLFEKVEGIWMLTGIDNHEMSKNANSDFYAFYSRFASDGKYQTAHIQNPFGFKTYDYDNFQSIEGLLEVAQWPDYRPELPKNVITNIDYGQDYASSGKRVLLLSGLSGGMNCTLTFVRQKGRWMLSRLEN